MRIIVSDSSCLIDLRKASLLDAFLKLPYELTIPNTGDGGLRELAVENRMEVHGVLWVIDEIHANGLAAREVLLAVLREFSNDQTVRLPKRELSAYIKRYEKEEG